MKQLTLSKKQSNTERFDDKQIKNLTKKVYALLKKDSLYNTFKIVEPHSIYEFFLEKSGKVILCKNYNTQAQGTFLCSLKNRTKFSMPVFKNEIEAKIRTYM